MIKEYVVLQEPTKCGCIIFWEGEVIGIATEDSTKAIRWENLSGFRRLLERGSGCLLESICLEGVGLYVLQVGEKSLFKEHVGFGSTIQGVASP